MSAFTSANGSTFPTSPIVPTMSDLRVKRTSRSREVKLRAVYKAEHGRRKSEAPILRLPVTNPVLGIEIFSNTVGTLVHAACFLDGEGIFARAA
jgi:hypothetical protein